jgi:hypothetical protein
MSDDALTCFVGGEGGGRTHTLSEQRQILSLVRLPVPPLRRWNLSTVYHS